MCFFINCFDVIAATSEGVCQPNEIYCDGQCHSPDIRCNGYVECSNNIDEENCPNSVSTTQAPLSSVFPFFFFLQIALSEYEIANYVVCVCFFFMNRDVPSMHVLMSQLATVMLKYVMGTTNVPMASMNMVAKVSPKDLLIPRIIE